MYAGILNIVLGVVGVVLGLQGRVLMFTNSNEAMIGLGAAIACFGVYQIYRSRRRGH